MFSQSSLTQLLKFITVGVSNTAISYVVFVLVFHYLLNDSAFYSQCISYGAGIAWSFFWNRKWTFSSQQSNWRALARFVAVQLGLLVLSAALLSAAEQQLSLNISISWVLVMAFITVLNFFLSKFLVFKK